MDYYPDKWVVLKITPKKGKVWYRVFGSWYGGYGGSDSWRANSGITKVESLEGTFAFHGQTGSVYYCHKGHYGTSGYSQSILNGIIKEYEYAASKLEVMPEDTNWLELSYDFL